MPTATARVDSPGSPTGFEVLDPTGKYESAARYARETLPQMLEHVGRRAGQSLQPPLTLVISGLRAGDRCAVRGLALSGARQIYLYVEPRTPRSVIDTGLSHELGHVLQTQLAGGDVGSATLAEGFATYVSGPYWPGWDRRTGFQEAVRRYRQQGRYIPLTQSHLSCDTATRDRIYTERAGFVEWLLETHGEEKFWRLNRLSARRFQGPEKAEGLPYVQPPVIQENPTYESAPWVRVYGSTLRQLEARWLSGLES